MAITVQPARERQKEKQNTAKLTVTQLGHTYKNKVTHKTNKPYHTQYLL